MLRLLVFNTTSYNVAVIWWWSVLLVEKIRVPRENHRHAPSHSQTLLTYLTYSTSSYERHRATTVSFHLILSWAFLFASPHVVFMACSSVIIPLCHEFFGLPLFLFPWRFHSKACFVMLLFAFLSVCPIHFHRLDLIVKLIGCCLSFSIVLYCWWYLATSLPR